VSGTRGHASVGDHAGIRGGRMSGQRSPPATSVDTKWSLWSPRGHGNWRAAQPDTGPVPLLSHATAASKWVGMVGVRSAWQRGGPFGSSSGRAADTAGHFRCSVPAMPSRVWTPADTPAAPGVRSAECAARGTGRRVDGCWWDAASAGARGRVGRSGGRGACSTGMELPPPEIAARTPLTRWASKLTTASPYPQHGLLVEPRVAGG
jgi:hypothetical protein